MHGKPDHNPNTPIFVGDSEVDLSRTDLRGAFLVETNLVDANPGAGRYYEYTQWPENFDP